MTQKIFKNIFLLAMTIFVACLVVLTSVLYTYFSQKKVEELRAEAQWLAAAVQTNGTSFLSGMQGTAVVRVTRVAADGTVMYDSVADSAQMENHGDREEIVQALTDGIGESTRYSSTLSEKTVNCAIRLKDGTVLRVSGTQYSVPTLIISMFTQIVLMLALAVLLSALLASRVSRAVIRPINEINLQHPDERDVYEELRPLVERINLQNRQIQTQMEQLQTEHDKQDQMRREFTANVSHELKTPLTSISGFAEILRDGLVQPEDVGRFAGNIYQEAQRLISLVNDILRLSRLDDQTIEEQTEAVELSALCREVIARLQPLAARRLIQFNLQAVPATVAGVPGILEEIVYNLCDNAVKYNKEGGTVTVSVSTTAENIRLTVSDTGIGIRQEELQRIFERFYRVDKSHSREMGGTGLGLSIVKHGAQLHHARISIDSQINVGTSISLTFPTPCTNEIHPDLT